MRRSLAASPCPAAAPPPPARPSRRHPQGTYPRSERVAPHCLAPSLAGFEVTIWQAANWNQDTNKKDTCEQNVETDCNQAGSNKTVYSIAYGEPTSIVIPTDPSTDVRGEICVLRDGTVQDPPICDPLGFMSQDSAAPDMIGRIGNALTVSDGIMPSSIIESRSVGHDNSTGFTIGKWTGMSFDVNEPSAAAGYGKFSLLEFTAPKSNTHDAEQLIDYQIVRTTDGKAYTLCCRENIASSHTPTRCSGDLGTCAPVGKDEVCTTSPEIKWVTVNGIDNYGIDASSEPRCRAGNEIKVWIGCTGALVRTADYNPLGEDADWHEQDPPTIQHGANSRFSATVCRDDYHVQPQTAYTWKIIARNDLSVSCKALEATGNTGSCNSGGDLSSEAFGWFSADASHTQSTATPNQPTGLTLYDAVTDSLSAQYNTPRAVLDATLQLKWNDPTITGGLAITQTRVWCKDQTEVAGVQTSRYGGSASWIQDEVKIDDSSTMAACDPAAADFGHCRKVTGLKAGTRYWCTTSAANSAGGLDEAEYFAWAAVGNTLDSFPSFIEDEPSDVRIQNLHEADSYDSNAGNSIIGQQGGAPGSTEPRLGLQFRCKTPRPNAVSLNGVGPTHYRVKWDSADGSGRTMNFSGSSTYPSSAGYQAYQILQDASAGSRDFFEYDTSYTIQVRAFNEITTDCNGPCKRHEAPEENDYLSVTMLGVPWRPPKPQNLAVKETLDRSVIITFEEPATTHGSPITHYVYQIWETGTSDSNPATPTDCTSSLDTSSWCSRKYMCQNNDYTSTSGWNDRGHRNYRGKRGSDDRTQVCSTSIADASSWHTTDGFRLTDGGPYVTYKGGLENTPMLEPETGYTVVVRAENAYGTGWPSDPVSFTTKTVPSKPELDPLVSVTSRSITVKWNEYSDGGVATAYKVYCRGDFQTGGSGSRWTYNDGALYTTIENITTSLSHTFADLTPGQAYNFWVKAVTPSGSDTGPSEGPYTADKGEATLEDDPDTPTVFSVGDDEFWKSRGFRAEVTLPYHNKACIVAGSGCSSTKLDEVELSISPPGVNGAIFKNDYDGAISNLQASTGYVLVTGLAPNVQYSIEVRVKSGDRWSSKSAAKLHTTCDEEPERISTVSALNSEKTNTSITLRWVAPVDGGTAITRFRVRASRASYCTAPYNPYIP